MTAEEETAPPAAAAEMEAEVSPSKKAASARRGPLPATDITDITPEEAKKLGMVMTVYGDAGDAAYYRKREPNLTKDKAVPKLDPWPSPREEGLLARSDTAQREEKAKLRARRLAAEEQANNPPPAAKEKAAAAAARVAQFRRAEEQRRREEAEWLAQPRSKPPPPPAAQPADAAAGTEGGEKKPPPPRPKALKPAPLQPSKWQPDAEVFAGIPSAMGSFRGLSTNLPLLVSELRREMPELPGLHVALPDTLLIEGGRLVRWFRTGGDGCVEDVDFEGATADDVLGCVDAWGRVQQVRVDVLATGARVPALAGVAIARYADGRAKLLNRASLEPVLRAAIPEPREEGEGGSGGKEEEEAADMPFAVQAYVLPLGGPSMPTYVATFHRNPKGKEAVKVEVATAGGHYHGGPGGEEGERRPFGAERPELEPPPEEEGGGGGGDQKEDGVPRGEGGEPEPSAAAAAAPPAEPSYGDDFESAGEPSDPKVTRHAVPTSANVTPRSKEKARAAGGKGGAQQEWQAFSSRGRVAPNPVNHKVRRDVQRACRAVSSWLDGAHRLRLRCAALEFVQSQYGHVYLVAAHHIDTVAAPERPPGEHEEAAAAKAEEERAAEEAAEAEAEAGAAVRIQAVHRGRAARREVNELRAQAEATAAAAAATAPPPEPTDPDEVVDLVVDWLVDATVIDEAPEEAAAEGLDAEPSLLFGDSMRPAARQQPPPPGMYTGGLPKEEKLGRRSMGEAGGGSPPPGEQPPPPQKYGRQPPPRPGDSGVPRRGAGGDREPQPHHQPPLGARKARYAAYPGGGGMPGRHVRVSPPDPPIRTWEDPPPPPPPQGPIFGAGAGWGRWVAAGGSVSLEEAVDLEPALLGGEGGDATLAWDWWSATLKLMVSDRGYRLRMNVPDTLLIRGGNLAAVYRTGGDGCVERLPLLGLPSALAAAATFGSARVAAKDASLRRPFAAYPYAAVARFEGVPGGLLLRRPAMSAVLARVSAPHEPPAWSDSDGPPPFCVQAYVPAAQDRRYLSTYTQPGDIPGASAHCQTKARSYTRAYVDHVVASAEGMRGRAGPRPPPPEVVLTGVGVGEGGARSGGGKGGGEQVDLRLRRECRRAAQDLVGFIERAHGLRVQSVTCEFAVGEHRRLWLLGVQHILWAQHEAPHHRAYRRPLPLNASVPGTHVPAAAVSPGGLPHSAGTALSGSLLASGYQTAPGGLGTAGFGSHDGLSPPQTAQAAFHHGGPGASTPLFGGFHHGGVAPTPVGTRSSFGAPPYTAHSGYVGPPYTPGGGGLPSSGGFTRDHERGPSQRPSGWQDYLKGTSGGGGAPGRPSPNRRSPLKPLGPEQGTFGVQQYTWPQGAGPGAPGFLNGNTAASIQGGAPGPPGPRRGGGGANHPPPLPPNPKQKQPPPQRQQQAGPDWDSWQDPATTAEGRKAGLTGPGTPGGAGKGPPRPSAASDSPVDRSSIGQLRSRLEEMEGRWAKDLGGNPTPVVGDPGTRPGQQQPNESPRPPSGGARPIGTAPGRRVGTAAGGGGAGRAPATAPAKGEGGRMGGVRPRRREVWNIAGMGPLDVSAQQQAPPSLVQELLSSTRRKARERVGHYGGGGGGGGKGGGGHHHREHSEAAAAAAAADLPSSAAATGRAELRQQAAAGPGSSLQASTLTAGMLEAHASQQEASAPAPVATVDDPMAGLAGTSMMHKQQGGKGAAGLEVFQYAGTTRAWTGAQSIEDALEEYQAKQARWQQVEDELADGKGTALVASADDERRWLRNRLQRQETSMAEMHRRLQEISESYQHLGSMARDSVASQAGSEVDLGPASSDE